MGYHGQKKLNTGVNPDTRVKELDADVAALRGAVESNHQVEGDLRRLEAMNIKRLIDIGTYRVVVIAWATSARAANPHQCTHTPW